MAYQDLAFVRLLCERVISAHSQSSDQLDIFQPAEFDSTLTDKVVVSPFIPDMLKCGTH